MVDLDGSFRYSHVLPVQSSAPVNMGITRLEPNPFTNTLNAGIAMPQPGLVCCTLTDLSGKVVFQKQTLLAKGFITLPLTRLQALNNGIYVLRVQYGQEIVTRKVVKQ